MTHELPQFPQVSRVITASVRVLGALSAIGAVVAFLWLNIFQDPYAATSPELALQQQVLVSPFSSRPHQALAAYYQNRNPIAAQREAGLALELQASPSSVLGLQAPVLSAEQQHVELWERIHVLIPDYRYALEQLVVLSYEMHNLQASQHYLQDLVHMAPSDTTVTMLEKRLKDYSLR